MDELYGLEQGHFSLLVLTLALLVLCVLVVFVPAFLVLVIVVVVGGGVLDQAVQVQSQYPLCWNGLCQYGLHTWSPAAAPRV